MKKFYLNGAEQFTLLIAKKVTVPYGENALLIKLDEINQCYLYSIFNDNGDIIDSGKCICFAK